MRRNGCHPLQPFGDTGYVLVGLPECGRTLQKSIPTLSYLLQRVVAGSRMNMEPTHVTGNALKYKAKLKEQ